MYVLSLKERVLPLLIGIIINLLLLLVFLDPIKLGEIFFFIVGVTMGQISALILTLFKYKISLHMTSISGLLMFVVGLSLHYQMNLGLIISLILLLTGLTASSRLVLRAHNGIQLIIGLFIGCFSQLLIYQYWL